MSEHDQGIIAIFAILGCAVALATYALHVGLHLRVRRLEKKLREHGIHIPY